MKIVFLCVANSARSQMAEGLTRTLLAPNTEVISAGSKPSFVHPLAIEAMKELNIDISGHTSKCVDELDLSNADFIITLCADEVCPVFIGPAQKLHWPFPDPATPAMSHNEQLHQFRMVRDQLSEKIKSWREEFKDA